MVSLFLSLCFPHPPAPHPPLPPHSPHHPASARAVAPPAGDAGGFHDAAPPPPAPASPPSVAANAAAAVDERAAAGVPAIGARLLTQPRAQAASPSGGAPPPHAPPWPGGCLRRRRLSSPPRLPPHRRRRPLGPPQKRLPTAAGRPTAPTRARFRRSLSSRRRRQRRTRARRWQLRAAPGGLRLPTPPPMAAAATSRPPSPCAPPPPHTRGRWLLGPLPGGLLLAPPTAPRPLLRCAPTPEALAAWPRRRPQRCRRRHRSPGHPLRPRHDRHPGGRRAWASGGGTSRPRPPRPRRGPRAPFRRHLPPSITRLEPPRSRRAPLAWRVRAAASAAASPSGADGSMPTATPSPIRLAAASVPPGAAPTGVRPPLPTSGGADAAGDRRRRVPPVAALPPAFSASPGAHDAPALPSGAAAAPPSPRLRDPTVLRRVERHDCEAGAANTMTVATSCRRPGQQRGGYRNAPAWWGVAASAARYKSSHAATAAAVRSD